MIPPMTPTRWFIEMDKRSVDLQLLRAAQVLQVVRNLVEWAADGGDFVFQGMESLSLTPERLLKHLALVVTGEAEVRALRDAGIEENAAMTGRMVFPILASCRT
ncbi:TPA: hypothetical protein ACH3X1_010937 [Trebouxia sp. C0004]